MERFYGEVGYGIESNTSELDVTDYRIKKRMYYGDILKVRKRTDSSEKLVDDISVDNQISIIADAFAYENFFCMKYVKWNGTRWKITSVEVQRPRLILSLGGVYNGPTE